MNYLTNISASNIVLFQAEQCKIGNRCDVIQRLSYSDGQELILQTPFIEQEKLEFTEFGNTQCIQIPMNEWIVNQIQIIENVVQSSVVFPPELQHLERKFRPIWKGEKSYFQTSSSSSSSSSCFKVIMIIENYGDLPSTDLGYGFYSFCIEFPYVYIGKHRNGETFSIYACCSHVWYKPIIMNILEIVNKQNESECSV